MSQGRASGSSEDASDVEVFNVECILAESWDNEKQCPLYLIKWDSYDLYESSWETTASFEEGADEALTNWEDVKRKRESGELGEFDLNEFEVQRVRWLKRLKRKRSQPAPTKESDHKPLKTIKLARLQAKAEAEKSKTTMSLPSETHLPTVPEEQLAGQRNSSPALVQQSPVVHDPPAEPASENDAGQSRSTTHMPSRPNRTKVSAWKKTPVGVPTPNPAPVFDESLYELPKKVLTMKKLNANLSKKSKADPSTLDQDSETPAVNAAPPPKPPRTLPKFSRAAQELREKREQSAFSEPNGASLSTTELPISLSDQERLPKSGSIHLSDRVAQNPNALLDLIVRIRKSTWELSISQVAYDSAKTFDTNIAMDYQSLRDRQVFHITKTEGSVVQQAAQDRLLRFREFHRFVVISAEDEKLDNVPHDLEIMSFTSFVA